MSQEKTRSFPLYVVRILDDKTLIINIGYDDNEEYYMRGIDEFATKVGDKIRVIEPGDKIIDPITKKELGFLDRTKEELEIVELLPKMAICKKIKKQTTSPGVIGIMTGMQPSSENISVPLNVNKSDIQSISFTKEPIKVGDPVQFK